MARLATNLLALRLLHPHAPDAAAARDHVTRGFTRQLQYVHPAGGFSAFGAADPSPSTWLTAFCLRYLRKTYQVISPGLPMPPAIERAERWLLGQQMENGCFRNEGHVFHRELKGGLNEEGEIASVALTAYVITSLVESSANLPFRVIRNSLSCLRAFPPAKSKTHTGVYAHSLLAYAFMRLRRYEEELKKTNEAYLWDRREVLSAGLKEDEEMRELMLLLKLAKRNRDYVYWESGSLSTSIEATGYAALALSLCPRALLSGCAADARAAARWLALHRSAAGGFVSTQDTLVAMEALTAWSSLQPTPFSNLTVTASNGRQTKTVTLQPGEKVPDIMKMGSGDQIDISVEGSGCALVQATRSYNTLSGDSSDGSLGVHVSVHTDGKFDCDHATTACFCAAVIDACVVWTGRFPEMALLEVALPGGFGADAQLLYAQLQQHTLLRRIELSSNGGKATLYLGDQAGGGEWGGGDGGSRCFALHAVGPSARTKPAHVKLFDYYRPSVKDIQMYTIPEDCPARIAHETNAYLPTDNLFNKAKSLETGEILISNEFSFEDIPEGTPLEDPIYENMEEKKDIIDISKTNENSPHKYTYTNVTALNIIQSKEHLQKQNGGKHPNLNLYENANSNIKSQANDEKFESNNNSSKLIDSYLTETQIDDKENQVLNQSTKLVSEKNLEHSTNGEKFETQNDGTEDNAKVDNPNLSDFHVIDSEKDLEVPSGIEGPVPSVVLPPKDFIFRLNQPDFYTDPSSYERNWRPFHPSAYSQGINVKRNIRHRRKRNYIQG
ncbi:unnamed protein product [Parnassius apollo]|uniref:(apollo) hypothetical protein n=1 Tax=Parnassius apollo TaxID=110799 RepID=A0A8S3XE73_PARAO|nr:unnamed protein product [Parnassius apollo]